MKSKLYFGLILLALLFSVCEKTKAQSPDWLWAKSMGGTRGEAAQSIAVDPASGDVYTTGYFSGTVDFDPGVGVFNLSRNGVFISKLDGSGNFVWAKSIGGIVEISAIALNPAGNGDVYATGRFEGTVDFDPGEGVFNLTSPDCQGERHCGDIFISKLDGEGNFVWAIAMGGTQKDGSYSIAVDPAGSGNVYIGGYSGYGIFISKLDSSGNFIWAKAMGGKNIDRRGYCSSIAIDPLGSGDVYFTGSFYGTVDFDPGVGVFNLSGNGVFISKLDGSGNFVWAKAMGTGGNFSTSIAVDPASGDVYTTGYFSGTVDFDPGVGVFNLTGAGYLNIFISKLDGSGNFVWAKSIGGIVEISAIALNPAGNGDVYATGRFEGTVDFDPGPGTFNLTSDGEIYESDIFISKLDVSGNFVWAKAMGGINSDVGSSIALDALGHLHVTGNFYSPSISFDSIALTNADTIGGNGTTSDIFIAKLDILTTSVVNVDSKTYQINIYPNPATDQLTIELIQDRSFNVEITMYNILGEVVFSSPMENIGHKKSIDISALASGIYFVELNIDGERVIEKVVKEKQ